MITSALSHNPVNDRLQQYYQTRQADLLQLGKALKSDDLEAAQQAYAALVNLGQHGPFKNGVPFAMANREQDFQAIGQALQAGDLSAAQAAFQALAATFHQPPSPGTTAIGQDSVSLSSLG